MSQSLLFYFRTVYSESVRLEEGLWGQSQKEQSFSQLLFANYKFGVGARDSVSTIGEENECGGENKEKWKWNTAQEFEGYYQSQSYHTKVPTTPIISPLPNLIYRNTYWIVFSKTDKRTTWINTMVLITIDKK